MFLLILLIWAIVIFSLRVTVFGNPLEKLTRKHEPEMLQRLDQKMTEQTVPEDLNTPETDFVQRFSRLAMLELGVLILEVGILLFFILGWEFEYKFYYWLCIFLLTKNALAFGLSWSYSRKLKEEEGLFSHLLNLPPWIVWADRISSLFSAAGMLLLVLKVSGIWPAENV